MKVTDYIAANKGKTAVSFEVLPPIKGGSMKTIYKTLDPLMEFDPPFIDVTYHREEYIYEQQASGYYEKIAIRKRPGTVGICAAIRSKYNVEAVPHLLCGGFTKEETENALIDLNFLQIDNVLVLRGDARRFEPKFIPQKSGHKYAVDLVKQVNGMNKGVYLDKKIIDGAKSDFCIGVAGYPEKHFEAPNAENDMEYLKAKVDAGADYIVTQMFFDNKKYFDFVDACRKNGIHVPIIAGLKPLTKKYQLNSIPRQFYVNFPQDLVKELNKVDDPKAIKQIGIEWAIAQSKELKENGVPCIHYYTMGDASTTKAVIKEII